MVSVQNGKVGRSLQAESPLPCIGRSLLLCSWEGLYIKGDGWVSCSLTKLSRLIGGVGAQTIPEDSVSTKQCHVTTQEGYFLCIAQFDPFPLWKHSRLSARLRPSEKDRKKSRSEEGDFEAFVSWSRRHSCPHAGEGKTDASQPLLPFTFSNLSSPAEDPSTGFRHAPENHEV